ncbi:hypothetical protein [Streptomyces qinglanensis]|uniref:hypothetical protein n=1 Tax=Streptomyces qinglanensis TaxID=943816 RepID=UPI0015A53758|nr:hypothetical protein [Streptomyces qinglanensis]
MPEPRAAGRYAGGLRGLPGTVQSVHDAAPIPDPCCPGSREPGIRRALAESGKHHLPTDGNHHLPTERQESGTH